MACSRPKAAPLIEAFNLHRRDKMSCMLRISGTNLHLKKLLEIDLIPDSTWEKGAPKFRTKPHGEKNSSTGARYLVSEADFDEFEVQKVDAIRFLKKNGDKIKEMMMLPNVDVAGLDFGIYMRDVLVQCDNFPAELAKLAGDLGLGLELTQYPNSEDDGGSEQLL